MYVEEQSMTVKRYSQLAPVILGVHHFLKSSNILVERLSRNTPHIPEKQSNQKKNRFNHYCS